MMEVFSFHVSAAPQRLVATDRRQRLFLFLLHFSLRLWSSSFTMTVNPSDLLYDASGLPSPLREGNGGVRRRVGLPLAGLRALPTSNWYRKQVLTTPAARHPPLAGRRMCLETTLLLEGRKLLDKVILNCSLSLLYRLEMMYAKLSCEETAPSV